ncbi:MAG: DUF1893 domain-containing protein [Chloroflexi bacterium]|nr:DUF1893 domain-containing protein [Chloroflexota bacterium]
MKLATMPDLFDEFMQSGDSLRVYACGKLLFSSLSDRLLPLMEYIGEFSPCFQPATIMDKLAGNAAALLAIKANCRIFYSPLASEHAVATLRRHDVEYHFSKIIPYIKKPDSKDMCPMEKLSLNKKPEEFYQAIRSMLGEHQETGIEGS